MSTITTSGEALPSSAPVLRVVSSMATRRWLARCLEGWRSTDGLPAALSAMGGVDAARSVRDGAPWDLVVLADDALTRLAAEGWVDAAGLRVLADSPMAAAVRRGAAPMDLSGDEAARGALGRVARIGCSTGPSGAALQATLQRWGLAPGAPGAPTLVQAPPGVPVGTLVQQGEVDIGFQQRSELLPFTDLVRLDALAPGLQHLSRFSGAPATRSARPRAAAELLSHLASADAARALAAVGMSPP